MWNKLELKHQIFASAVALQRGSFISFPNILKISCSTILEEEKTHLAKMFSDANMFVKKVLTVSIGRGAKLLMC